jgi:ribosomal-protein-alanine N-acetyltransferase
MQLELPECRIRSWRHTDEAELARQANSRRIWLNVRDHFPHPYTRDDARAWLERVVGAEPESQFAIEIEGTVAGGIGLMLQEDVARVSAELGYWLGEVHWGRGVMSAAVRALTEFGFAAFELRRIYALVFEWNPASMRVLEKAGFTFEGRMRQAVIKDGRVMDQMIYARVR